MVNILYSFDSKFLMLAIASIYSLLRNKKDDTTYTFYCMVAPKTRGRKKIEKMVKKFGCKLVWREIKKNENPYRGFDYARWSPVIFYRLFAYKIFPNLGRVIYLDSDTIVVDDLSDLYNFDLGDCVLGGVQDYGILLKTDNHVQDVLTNYMKSDLYINSGVLLIDLTKMPDEILSANCQLLYPDQDLINVSLDGKIARLPASYNCIPEKDTPFFIGEGNKPVIYHYYSLKPYYHSNLKAYMLFENLVSEIGMKSIDFIEYEKKFKKTKTNASFFRLKDNKIKFFGITVCRL